MPGIPVLLAVFAIGVAPPPLPDSPAEGLQLAPIAEPVPGSAAATPLGITAPLGVAGMAGLGAVTAMLAGARQPGSRRGRREDGGPLFVFVPGHGGSADDFTELRHLLDVEEGRARTFDYRWAHPSGDPVTATRRAHSGEAASALHGYLAALAEQHNEIYLVGHSKGGAVIIDMVSRWDDQPRLAVEQVTGAAILDPPIARGFLGDLQRFGYPLDAVADNGLFSPERCGWITCRDVREHLGDSSGVEVFVVRNPDAVVTNFHDEPEGLRVYDLVDDGGSSALWRLFWPPAFVSRVTEAHRSVLTHRHVAACIAAEASVPGSCRWPRPKTLSRTLRGRGGGSRLRPM